MIYKANGEIYNPPGDITRKMLSMAQDSLNLKAFARPSKFEEIMKINELRKSCGVEPRGGKTVTFRKFEKDNE